MGCGYKGLCFVDLMRKPSPVCIASMISVSVRDRGRGELRCWVRASKSPLRYLPLWPFLEFFVKKSVNLEYNTLVHWVDGTNVLSTKRPLGPWVEITSTSLPSTTIIFWNFCLKSIWGKSQFYLSRKKKKRKKLCLD